MHTENTNSQSAFDLVQSKDFIASVAAILMPALSEAVNEAVEKAVSLSTSPTMSKQDFASANCISMSVLEKRIANGVVLLAPTPSVTYTQARKNKKTGEIVETTMTKHGNSLINVAAWREKTASRHLNVATSNLNLILQVRRDSSMFDFELSSHPHFDNACRDFATRHNLATLAERAGIKPQTLRNKLNPEQFHELTVKEMLSLIAVTEDMSLMDGALSQLKCLPAVAVNELATESLPVYVMKATSEIG